MASLASARAMTSRPAAVVVVAWGLTTSRARTARNLRAPEWGTAPGPIVGLVARSPGEPPAVQPPQPPSGGARDRPSGLPPAPAQVRVAGVLVGLQGVAALVFAVLLGVDAGGSWTAAAGEIGMFVVIAAALAAAGAGLVTGRRWARTPAIVAQVLLLPVVYSLIGPSHQLVAGIATGVYVATTFLLLISEPARAWSAAPYERG